MSDSPHETEIATAGAPAESAPTSENPSEGIGERLDPTVGESAPASANPAGESGERPDPTVGESAPASANPAGESGERPDATVGESLPSGENPADESGERSDPTVGESVPTSENPAGESCERPEGESSDADWRKIRKRKILGNLFFVLVSAAVILGMTLFENRSSTKISPREAFRLLNANYRYAILAVSAFFAIVLTDAASFWFLTHRLDTPCGFGNCAKVAFLGRYFDRITPWAMGGEPFQIVYLHKTGLSSGDSSAVTMSRHIIRFAVVALAVMPILVFSRITTNAYVMAAAILSLFAGLIIPAFMLVCSYRPAIGQKITAGLISLACRMRLVKDRARVERKANADVDRFLEGVRYISANRLSVLVVGMSALLELFLNNSVPFLVLRAFGVTGARFWQMFVLSIFINYAASFAPTPGGSGVAELSFYAIFASNIRGGVLFYAVLLWRVCLFYLPVFIGFVIQSAIAAKDIRRMRKGG